MHGPRDDWITLYRYGHLMPGNEEEAAVMTDARLALAAATYREWMTHG